MSADNDPRFTIALLADIFSVLEKHGYRQPDEVLERHRASGAALPALLDLARAFEGLE